MRNKKISIPYPSQNKIQKRHDDLLIFLAEKYDGKDAIDVLLNAIALRRISDELLAALIGWDCVIENSAEILGELNVK